MPNSEQIELLRCQSAWHLFSFLVQYQYPLHKHRRVNVKSDNKEWYVCEQLIVLCIFVYFVFHSFYQFTIFMIIIIIID